MSNEGAWIVLLLAAIAGGVLGGWIGAAVAVGLVIVLAG